MKSKRAVRTTFNSDALKGLVGQLEKRFGPKTELALNHLSKRIGPAVAKVHKWCEQRNQAAPATKKRTKKDVTES